MLSLKNIFQESAVYYEKYLRKSEYKTKLQYQQPNQSKQKEKKTQLYLVQSTIQQVS